MSKTGSRDLVRLTDAFRFWKAIRSGHLRVAILRLLKERDMHGYEIMNEVRGRTGGVFAPLPGTVYPILRELETHKHVASNWEPSSGKRKKRVYQITDKGMKTLSEFDSLSKEARKNLQGTLTRASKLLDIDSSVAKTKADFASFRGMGFPPLMILLQKIETEKSRTKKLSLLKQARSIIRARVKSLEEREKAISMQILALEKQSR